MTTIENNKLLAVFLGGKYKNQTNIPLNDNEIWLPKFGVCNLGNNGKVLKFHNNWNWLMEVVEKIEGLNKDISILIIKNSVIVNNRNNYKKETFGNTKIEAVYNACVEFVKWYNENNPIN
jgi:hypothetical protein